MKYKFKRIDGITIDESAKEDFKAMMDWGEGQWEYYTEKEA